MEGLYFDTEFNVLFSAEDSSPKQLDLLLDKDSYGLYNSNFIVNMPSTNYTSGTVTLSTTSYHLLPVALS